MATSAAVNRANISSAGGGSPLASVAHNEAPAAAAAVAHTTANSTACGRSGPWLNPIMLASRNHSEMRTSSVRDHWATSTWL